MGTSVDAGSGRQLAVVTGASNGIGFELAKQFARHGYDVVLAAEDAAVEAAAAEVQALGGRATAVQVDLATFDGCEELYRRAGAEGRPVEALALNAGVGVGGPFLETSLEEELRLIALNCNHTVHLSKRFAKDMVARGRGRVLVTSSIAAQMPAPFEAVYGASKAFGLMFAEALRNELKDTGVTVTALQPGPTETNFFHRAGMDDTRVGQSGSKDTAEAVAKQGFEGLIAGRDHVVAASVSNKLQSVLLEIMPETMKAELHRKLSEPGSGSK